MLRIPHLAAVLLAIALVAPSGASADPPANDSRTTPEQLGALPVTVRATTVEATTEPDEPFSACPQVKNSVWYEFTAASDRDVLVALDAAGDMDAVVDVFERQRSQIFSVACQATDRRGEATVDLDANAGTDYLIRVAPLSNSVADAFTLRVVVPDEPARPPGEPLPGRGVNAFVDRFANPDDAWAVRLREGVTYRINFVTSSPGCAQMSLFPASTGFSGSPLRALGCDAHTVFTPPQSGRYTLLVRAPRASRARLNYRLRVGRALDDDTAPGLPLANDDRRRGALQGSELDALDLYRFTIERRSDLRVRLQTAAEFDVLLLNRGGRRLSCGCGGGAGDEELERRLAPGAYFLAVRARDGADGSYTLSRLARTITRSRTLVDGQRSATVPPGRSVALSLRVTPDVAGRARMVVERFDPLAGWLFDARFRPRVSGGSASVAFRPPSVGLWRVTAEFLGTRIASPSRGGTAGFRVEET